jgi:hypothetical protein
MLQISSIYEVDNYARQLSPEEALAATIVATIATLEARGACSGPMALGGYFKAEGLHIPDDVTANEVPEVAEGIANSFMLWSAQAGGLQ